MTQTPNIGDRLREARKRRGLAQRELAKRSGVSVSLIRKLEQGERDDTRIETLRSLAVALGVRTTYLIMDMLAPSPGTVTDAMWAPLREALAHPGAEDHEPGTPEGIARSLAAAVRL